MSRVVAAALAAIVAALPACAAGPSDGPRGPVRLFPDYTGHSAELFDDAFEPAALGAELVPKSRPANDALLRERTQVGDAVVRAQLRTITSKDEATGRTWQMGFRSLERLAGSRPLDADFTVKVESNGLSAGVLRMSGDQLMGKTFIAFVREFAHPADPTDSELHFHLAADTKPDVAAVRAATWREQVR